MSEDSGIDLPTSYDPLNVRAQLYIVGFHVYYSIDLRICPVSSTNGYPELDWAKWIRPTGFGVETHLT